MFPLAITGATAVVPDVTARLPGAGALGPWIVLAYNGLFAAALLLAGATADRTARTRFFAAGNIVVAATGVLSALAPDLLSLVVLRVVAGVGAAMCAAGGSSMILAVYPPQERRRVYGYAGAALFSTARMSLETLTLATATGVMAALGPSSGLAVAGAVCLTAAVIVRQAVPSRDT
ncbi:MFS transporter [Streptosporangium canum]|uniref:MFS transporter n=1 Tax=Streptosporangium canum TaxID=324952 RepID=UPI0036908525